MCRASLEQTGEMSFKSSQMSPWDGQRRSGSRCCALLFIDPKGSLSVPFTSQPSTLDTDQCVDREGPLPNTWPLVTLQG